MSEIHWVKLSTQMFDDEKIKVIETMPSGGDICLIWVKLIVLAGRTNDNGMVYLTKNLPYTPDMLARIFSKSVETVRMALDTFLKLGMVEIDKDSVIVLVNWEKYQNIDGMERIRKLTAERVRRLREKRKLLTCNVTGDATVTPGNAIDSDSDSDSEEDKKVSTPSGPPLRPKADPKPRLFFNFDDSLWYGISDEQVALWAEAYPAVDIDLELRQMGEWCKSNGAKGHKQDWRKFVVNWLKRSQDKGGSAPKGDGGWKSKRYSR